MALIKINKKKKTNEFVTRTKYVFETIQCNTRTCTMAINHLYKYDPERFTCNFIRNEVGRTYSNYYYSVLADLVDYYFKTR